VAEEQCNWNVDGQARKGDANAKTHRIARIALISLLIDINAIKIA
jgi:hypothetical protein